MTKRHGGNLKNTVQIVKKNQWSNADSCSSGSPKILITCHFEVTE